MEPTSQIVLRNRGRLPQGPLLLVNSPRDALGASLRGDGLELRHSCQDFADFRWLHAGGLPARFEAIPSYQGDESLSILNLPREKERLAMTLHALASRMPRDSRLWLVGENRAGIKSARPYLERRFDEVSVVDKARHCVLYQAAKPLQSEAFSLDDYTQWWNLQYDGLALRLCSLPGVFAHGRLDPGTGLLLETVRSLEPAGRLLDFACGGGIVGVALSAAGGGVLPTLLDTSALALECARRSLERNGLDGDILPSDGFSELAGRFDWIVSNPPFHRGVRSDLDVAAALFREAANYLDEHGKIVVVFNRHLPYIRWMRDALADVEVLADDGDYRVVVAGAGGRRGNAVHGV